MKKVQSFSTSVIIHLPASSIWNIIAKDFGNVQNYADQIYESGYVNGHTQGGENCQRVCYLNKKKTNFYIEKMTDVDSINMSYTNVMIEVGKLPIVPGISKATFNVKAISNNSCELTATSEYRTKPAFMGALFKGKFKNTMTDYLISIASYAQTGNSVNKDNFKQIKKDYLASQTR